MSYTRASKKYKQTFENFPINVISLRFILREHLKNSLSEAEKSIDWLLSLEDSSFTFTHYLADYQDNFIAQYKGMRQNDINQDFLAQLKGSGAEIAKDILPLAIDREITRGISCNILQVLNDGLGSYSAKGHELCRTG
jgi:hypothetical protein